MGLSRISMRDVIVGTFLASLPHTALYVVAGNDPRLLATAKFIVFETVAHVVLLTPLALRYWKPQWFQRLGME